MKRSTSRSVSGLIDRRFLEHWLGNVRNVVLKHTPIERDRQLLESFFWRVSWMSGIGTKQSWHSPLTRVKEIIKQRAAPTPTPRALALARMDARRELATQQ